MNELSKIEEVTVKVYTDGKMNDLVTKIEKEVSSFVPVLDTAKGRKEIASLAHKIARSKTCLDGLGKTLIEESQKTVNAVNSERKNMRDRLDTLKEKVRKPLTEWEEKEQFRLEEIDLAVAGIPFWATQIDEHDQPLSSKAMKENLGHLKTIKIDASFGDRQNEAAQIKDNTIQKLEASIARREKEETEKAELDRLRKEKEEQEEKDRIEKIRKEGEERVRLEVEENAREEKEREEKEREEIEKKHQEELDLQEKEKQDEIDRLKKEADKAEQKRLDDIKAIEEKAEAERLETIRLREEKERTAREEKEREEKEEKKRQEDKEHRTKINKNILSALSNLGIKEETGKTIITEIVQGHIPNVKINY